MFKRIVILGILLGVLLGGCVKPQYKTKAGKQKLRHYNNLYNNKSDWDKARMDGKKKKKRKKN